MDSLLKIAIEQIPDPVDPDEMLPVRNQLLVNFERHGFIAGANWMRQELLRWRNPNIELPEEYQNVLCKYVNPNLEGKIITVATFTNNTFNPHFYISDRFTLIGWRPVCEL